LVLAPDAVRLVHHYSKGIPRLINLICEHSMITGYVEQMKPIPACIVESVCIELDLHLQPFLVSPLALSGSTGNTMPTAMYSTPKSVVNATDSLKEREI
jgi:hypothetical protein